MKNKRWQYFVAMLACAAVALAVAYLTPQPEQQPDWLQHFTNGFGGNITSGLVTGILLAPLALYLTAETDAAVSHIRTEVERQKRIFDNERKMRAFERVLEKDSYYDILFPDLRFRPDSYGLQYTILPIRDPDTGLPVKYEDEMQTLYVIKVDEPAQRDVLSKEQREEYDHSPIEVGKHYFCAFFNDSWHLGEDNINQPYKFFPSGKVGPVIHGMPADDFVKRPARHGPR